MDELRSGALAALCGATGEDCFREHRGLGVSRIDFRVLPEDSGGLLVLENTFHARGGPAKHLHHHQDELFYALKGEFLLEVGGERFAARTARSAPRLGLCGRDSRADPDRVQPGGRDGSFFCQVTKADAMPPQDPALWRAHGMELLGPPLSVA